MDFPYIRDKLVTSADLIGLRKEDGHMYLRMHACPAAYVKYCTFIQFIADTFVNDAIFDAHKRQNHGDAMKFLKNYSIIPDLDRDKDLISFQNGVLHLGSMTFDPRPSGEGPAARHHIAMSYTGSLETPAMDSFLRMSSMEHDVSEVLFSLIGRLFFDVGQHDHWRIALYVYGTGASQFLDMVTRLFAADSIGHLPLTKARSIFDNYQYLSNDVIIGRNSPSRLSLALPPELLRPMASGELMSVSVRRKTAVHVQWHVPIVIGGNTLPDYLTRGSRRIIVPFRIEATDLETEAGLSLELANIVCRSLASYAELGRRVKLNAGSGFWSTVPRSLMIVI